MNGTRRGTDPAENKRMGVIGRLLNALFMVLGFGFAAGTLVILIVRAAFGEAFPFIGLYNNLLPAALLPVIVLLPLALVLRRWLLVGLSLVLVGVGLWWYSPFFMPSAATPTPDERVLTVMSYNVRSTINPLEVITAIVDAAQPDLLALQELHPNNMEAVIDALTPSYPHFVTGSDQGLFSKYPLDDTDTAAVLANNPQADLLRAVVDVDGDAVTVMVFHPQPPRLFYLLAGGTPQDDRATAYDQLLDVATAEAGRVIIVGDFNATDRSTAYQRVTAAGFNDTYHDVGYGLGLTFPNFTPLAAQIPRLPPLPDVTLPLLRIDYVMHRGGFRSLDARVLYDGKSDHYPLVVRLGMGASDGNTP